MASNSKSIGLSLRAHGWSGGAVIPIEHHGQVAAVALGAPIVPSDCDWIAVISQSCDLLAHTAKQEPYAELLLCTPVTSKPRPEIQNIRSTRTLEFRPNGRTHPRTFLTAHATTRRFLIDRDILNRFGPDPARVLSRKAFDRICRWYGIRYTRPAWPDAFVDRLNKKALEEALAPLDEDDVAQVRIALAPADQELTPEDPYSLAIFFVVDEHVWTSDPARRIKIHAVFAEFLAAIRSCENVIVNEELSGVVPGNEFTWQEAEQTDLWNFAFLSHRNDD